MSDELGLRLLHPLHPDLANAPSSRAQRGRGFAVMAAIVAVVLIATTTGIYLHLAGEGNAQTPRQAPTKTTATSGPVFARIPPVGSDKSCTMPAIFQTYGTAAATVDPDPVSVTVAWYSPHWGCLTPYTHGDGTVARSLAELIRTAPVVTEHPPLLPNCPFGDGSEALLYFTYSRSAQAELAVAALSGCLAVYAPNRSDRGYSSAFGNDLDTLTPSPMRHAAN